VVLAIDDSPHSSHALDWTVSNLAHPQDELHCVVVALPVPYPILDESSAAVAALEAQEWQHSSERNFAYARELASCAAAAAVASGKVERGRAVAEALVPEGGASDVGAAIVKYAKRQQVRKGWTLFWRGRGWGKDDDAVFACSWEGPKQNPLCLTPTHKGGPGGCGFKGYGLLEAECHELCRAGVRCAGLGWMGLWWAGVGCVRTRQGSSELRQTV